MSGRRRTKSPPPRSQWLAATSPPAPSPPPQPTGPRSGPCRTRTGPRPAARASAPGPAAASPSPPTLRANRRRAPSLHRRSFSPPCSRRPDPERLPGPLVDPAAGLRAAPSSAASRPPPSPPSASSPAIHRHLAGTARRHPPAPPGSPSGRAPRPRGSPPAGELHAGAARGPPPTALRRRRPPPSPHPSSKFASSQVRSGWMRSTRTPNQTLRPVPVSARM
nr:serine/arginine repetitive matrix protein 1-like [Aegilops tauschii subsp. strangulata]